jgi:hypothetical protein
MDDPQYVHNDVPSDYLCEHMLYYTYHSHVDARQYVTMMYLQAACVTDCFITHITAMTKLTCMWNVMQLQATYFTEYFITHITTK